MFKLFQSLRANPARPPQLPNPGSIAATSGTLIVADDQGRRIHLDGILARGGEGTVHRTVELQDFLVKIYHPEILADRPRRERLRLKIAEMAQNPRLRQNEQLAWPLTCLTTPSNDSWCGYAMRLRQGVSLRELCGNPRNFGRTVPGWHRQHLVRLCLDFLGTIEELSRNKTLPVDFNPSNFLVDPTSIRMNFIDCDSYQFGGSSVMHLSEAILPEMTAPEVLRQKTWKSAPVMVPSLRFSIGMILFYILNLGNSPYRHRNGHDPVQNLMDGACALGRGAKCEFPPGSSYLIWSHLIFDLKELFIRCFREGHSNPAVRPSIGEWSEALLKYNHCLKMGHADASPMPPRSKSAEFRRDSNH